MKIKLFVAALLLSLSVFSMDRYMPGVANPFDQRGRLKPEFRKLEHSHEEDSGYGEDSYTTKLKKLISNMEDAKAGFFDHGAESPESSARKLKQLLGIK